MPFPSFKFSLSLAGFSLDLFPLVLSGAKLLSLPDSNSSLFLIFQVVSSYPSWAPSNSVPTLFPDRWLQKHNSDHVILLLKLFQWLLSPLKVQLELGMLSLSSSIFHPPSCFPMLHWLSVSFYSLCFFPPCSLCIC